MSKKDNMKLWSAVDTTDPEYTRHVNQRGGFTAIDAQWQIQQATEQWGPYGGAWGVRDLAYDYVRVGNDIVEVSLEATFWFPGGEFPLGTDMAFRAGNESKKKLLTDLTTKALSKLGFSADVFMGKFNDNRYVQENKPAPKREARAPRGNGSAPPTGEPKRQETMLSSSTGTSDPQPDWPVPPCPECREPGLRRDGTSGRQPPFSCSGGCTEESRNGKEYPKSYWRASEKKLRFVKKLMADYCTQRDDEYESLRAMIGATLDVPDTARAYSDPDASKVIDALLGDLERGVPFETSSNAVDETDVPF